MARCEHNEHTYIKEKYNYKQVGSISNINRLNGRMWTQLHGCDVIGYLYLLF